MKALRIDTDGKVEMVEIDGSTVEETNDSIWEILGGYYDVIRLAWDAAMLVDDEGICKDLPVNPVAMRVSGYPFIAGTALVVGLDSTDDGEVFTDCPEHYAEYA